MDRRHSVKVMLTADELKLLQDAAEKELLKTGTYARRVLVRHATKLVSEKVEA